MNELIYSTIDFLILKGQYYLTVYNNEERALRFFRRAETIALDAYDYLNPSLLKSLVKTRLLFSKMLIKNNEFKKSLKLLWKNINTLKLECSIRMGKEMGAMKPNDQKMKKWCKYFIMNLHQMIFCYTQLGEVSAANETGIMMEWLAEGFFENKSLFFLNVADFSHHLKETSRYYIRMKANTEYHFMNIIEKYFHPELFEKFLKKKEKIKTGIGFIPSSESEKSGSGVVEMQIYGPVIKPGKFSSKKMSYKVSNGGNLSKRDSISLKSPQIKTRTKSFSTIRKPILNEIERPSHQNNNQSISTQYTSAFTSGILKPSKSPKIPEFDIYVNEKLQKDFGNTGYKVKKKSLSQRFMIKNGGGSRRVDKRKKSKKKGKSNKGIMKRAVSVRSNKTILKNFNLMDVVKNSKADKECKEI